MEVPGYDINSVNLETKTVNTKNLFPKSDKQPQGIFYAENNLEEAKEGGLLMFEVANFGGSLTYKLGDTRYETTLPLRLPRDITGAYLNCAGDLIRPDNELTFNEITVQ